MGIPRLTQDLQPYLEDAIISSTTTSTSTVRVEKLVIDGPSMVYHVYNRLTAHPIGHLQDDKDIYSPPCYTELCSAVDHFLQDLESCGAEMCAIPAGYQWGRANELVEYAFTSMAGFLSVSGVSDLIGSRKRGNSLWPPTFHTLHST